MDLELLEELEPALARAFQATVGMAELTSLAVQASPRGAVVLTNRYLYLVRRTFWGRVRCVRLPLEEVREAWVDGQNEGLAVKTVGQAQVLLFSPAKKRLLPAVVARVNRAVTAVQRGR